MKSLIFLLVTLLYSCSINAEVISSSFGFSVNIPATWTPYTLDEIKNNPDFIDMDNVEGLSAELFNKVKPMILSGQVELFFMPDSSSGFSDNVNVIKQPGKVPGNKGEIESTCKSLPGQLSSMFKRPMKMYKCEVRNIGNIASFYVEFDGAIVGTRSMMYQIPKSNNVYLAVTATVKDSRSVEMGEEFDTVMKTFELN